MSGSDARQAQDAVLAAGFNPRLIGIHTALPSVIPPAALIGSAVSLVLLVLAVSILSTRAQVRSMRGWAAQLTDLGVSARWAKRAISVQYVWVGVLAVPVGVAVSLVTLYLTAARLPDLDLVVPIVPIAGVIAILVGSTSLGAAVAVRNLHRG